MKRTILILLTALLSAAPLLAQYSPCYEAAFAEGQRQFKAGKYKIAKKYFNESKSCPDPNTEAANEWIGKCNNRLAENEKERQQKEEDEAFANCTTESACEEYLENYPEGRYYPLVLAKQTELEEERLHEEREAAKTAYMKLKKIEFANSDVEGNIFDSYGFTMYASEVKCLKPRIAYDGILDDPKFVVLYCKIVTPDGSIKSNSISPEGYTFLNSFWVQPGNGNTYELPAWGSSEAGTYVTGNYKLEIWYEGSKIYQTTFIIKDKENALSRGNWRLALGKCHDHVTKEFDNGSYKGQLHDGSRSGLGMYWKKGGCYIGNWRSDNQNGSGIKISSQNNTISNCSECAFYVGEWASNDKSGEGTCYDRFGNLIYNGTFVNDKPAQTYPMTGYNNYRFECIEYSGGDCYLGETKKGIPHGKGIYIWSCGDLWYGNWVDGDGEGYGLYMPYQGPVSTITWKGITKQ